MRDEISNDGFRATEWTKELSMFLILAAVVAQIFNDGFRVAQWIK